jgi:hypothetical protein
MLPRRQFLVTIVLFNEEHDIAWVTKYVEHLTGNVPGTLLPLRLLSPALTFRGALHL